MKLAIASGKGGTGKTSLAAALGRALAAADERLFGAPPLLLDCDVEAPDLHLFLSPGIERREAVTVAVPRVLMERCDLCGECARACQFNAIAILADTVRVFPALCHGCGTCTLVCPEHAITEDERPIGWMESGAADGIEFAHGVLNVGEAMAVPVIQQLKEWMARGPETLTILDAPPGTSCPVVETLSGCDYVILVTEPTPFGFHDLRSAVGVVRELGIPAGVVVNRDGADFPALEDFCAHEELPILLRIPFSRSIAQGIAQGKTLVDLDPYYGPALRHLMRELRERVGRPVGSSGASTADAGPLDKDRL